MTELRLLASTNNARGDLFTRLAKDVFFALGYEVTRINVHKTGRELDIEGSHRLEPRRVIAECKAQASKTGGDALNKFLGVLTRERRQNPSVVISGYFISLSGFSATASEQEAAGGTPDIILLDGSGIPTELQKGRLLVSEAVAVDQAARCVANVLTDAILDGIELLGHELGYPCKPVVRVA